MPLYDFHCPACDSDFEALAKVSAETIPCQTEGCAGEAVKRLSGTHTFSVIQATHLHSLKRKAGYVHSHGDRPKTPGKIQVGYGS